MGQDKITQDKTRQSQDKTRQSQDKTRKSQDKTRQDKIRQNKKRQDKTRHNQTRKDKARQGKTRQDKARQDKARQGKARQDKTRQGKTRKGRRKELGGRSQEEGGKKQFSTPFLSPICPWPPEDKTRHTDNSCCLCFLSTASTNCQGRDRSFLSQLHQTLFIYKYTHRLQNRKLKIVLLSGVTLW